MSDGMRREFTYLSSHATNRYFIPNWGNLQFKTPYCIKHKSGIPALGIPLLCFMLRSLLLS